MVAEPIVVAGTVVTSLRVLVHLSLSRKRRVEDWRRMGASVDTGVDAGGG